MSATIVLDQIGVSEDTQFTCNGDVEERAALRERFNALRENGGCMMTVVDNPGHSTQVTSFDQVEEIERDRIANAPDTLPVEVRAHRPLAGG